MSLFTRSAFSRAAIALIILMIYHTSPSLAQVFYQELEAPQTEYLLIQGTVAEPIQLAEPGTTENLEADRPKQPLRDAIVMLCDKDYKPIFVTSTDKRGQFEVFLEPSQEYHLVTDKNGYWQGFMQINTAASFTKPSQRITVMMVSKDGWKKHLTPQLPAATLAELDKVKTDFLSQQVVFRVELGTYSKAIDLKLFNDFTKVREFIEDGQYTYTAGEFDNFKAAKAYQQAAVANNFEHAKVAAYQNDHRVPMARMVGGVANR